MPLETFCDLAWVEIWDDVTAMSDIHTYHRIVTELFIEGKDPYEIKYEVTEYDKKGKPVTKVKRLADAPTAVSRAQRMLSQGSILEQWKTRSAELKAGGSVASSPDG